MQNSPVSVSIEQGIAQVWIDNPPVNATSLAVRLGLKKAVDQVNQSKARVAILRCKGKTFVAGGDITEFDKPPVEPHLADLCNAIETSPVPFIAAMHGTVLGGGFEIALACSYRVALAGTRFGLPEVNIGLIPGAGGTQRLPRLVSLEHATDITCTGRMFPAKWMHEIGALDAIVEDLDEAVLKFAQSLTPISTKLSARKAPLMEAAWHKEKQKALKKRSKGQQSPLHALDAIKWAGETTFEDGLKRERSLFLTLKSSAESKALRHAFFAERKAAKPAILQGQSTKDIEHVAVIGGGLMGAGIAVACVSTGYQVTLIEQDDAAADAARTRVDQLLEGAVSRGKLSAEQKTEQIERFKAGSNYGLAKDCDLAIEAVFEDLQTKKDVFKKLANVMREDALLATNTSYLNPDLIFETVPNQKRCLGLHFFSPAHVMKLLEIVQGGETSPEALATAFSFAKHLKKVSVLSGICDGFIGNRILAAYRRQADYMLADGALPYEIDAAMRAFGMPMGPYELQDLTGLQIAWATRKRQAASRDPLERYIPLGDQLCESGRFGQRSGKGWYHYEDGNRTPIRDDHVESMIEAYSKAEGITRKTFSTETIQNRLIAALANEGALIVESGFAQSYSDVDVAKLYGYGFPRWRGGPMHYVEQIGTALFGEYMKEVAVQSPNSWSLSNWLAG